MGQYQKLNLIDEPESDESSTPKDVTLTPVNWEELYRCLQDLPSAPSVSALVLDVVSTPDMQLSELEAVLLLDPALTTQVLRLANSTLYGVAGRISTMSHALARMQHAAKLVALSFHLEDATIKDGFDYQEYWRHSAACSLLAANLARHFPEVNIEEARAAGLLVRAGQLFLSRGYPLQYQRVLARARETGLPIENCEQEMFGTDHATAAGIVLAHWQFPRTMVNAIQSHRQTRNIEGLSVPAQELAKVLHLASLLTELVIDRETDKLAIAASLAEVWARLDSNTLDDLLVTSRGEFERRDCYFGEHDASPQEILGAARKQMIDFSLITAENLNISAQRADENEKQLEALQRERDRLAEQVTTDPLTGIGNRKNFDIRLREEIKRCQRTKTPVALILFDLDHFKRLNDTFGHQAGDMVLRTATKEVRKALRTTDIVCRYGGEEFAVIAPGTDAQGAIASAERMRQCLEAVSVLYNGRRLKITASFGVTAVEHPDNIQSIEHLIEITDESLYAAKHAGRNCVKHQCI